MQRLNLTRFYILRTIEMKIDVCNLSNINGTFEILNTKKSYIIPVGVLSLGVMS